MSDNHIAPIGRERGPRLTFTLCLRFLKLPERATDKCGVNQKGIAATTPVAVQREDRFRS